MTVTDGNVSDLEPVVNEDETPVSEIPYPEGTAPPVLDDAKHATIQLTLTEAIVQAAIRSGAPEELVYQLRSLTAAEAINTLLNQLNLDSQLGLAQAFGEILYLAFAGGSEPEPEIDMAEMLSNYGIGVVELDDDAQHILKYKGYAGSFKYALMDNTLYPVYSFTALEENYYLIVTSTGGDAYAFKKSSEDMIGISVNAEFHKYYDANTTIPAQGCVYISSSTGVVGTIAGDGNIDVTGVAISVPNNSAFRSSVNFNIHASSIVVHPSSTDCYIRNTSSSAVTKNAGDDMANGKLMPQYLYD